MARLDSLQRDNTAMRKEIAALRQREQRSAPAQTVETRNASIPQLSPAASAARAADYPVKGRYAEPPRAFTWDGFYMGVHAGYGWGNNNWGPGSLLEEPTSSTTPLSPKTGGILGGIQAGANFQMQNWVFGIEADVAFMKADARSNGVVLIAGAPVAINVIGRSQIDWLATFTGRFGYAFDRSLIYAKGGVAAAEFKDGLLLNAPSTPAIRDYGTKDGTRVGWTVGAGWEYAFAANWSAKVEYNYLDLGRTTEVFNFSTAPTSSFQYDIERKVQILKAGVNYRF
ncbi:MAG: outer membrane protein [Pseudomonadota bacterium]